VVTGAVNRKKWVDGLEKALSHLPKGEKVDNKFAHQGPKQEERVYKTLQKEQSHIILGFKGLTLTDPRRYALQVIQSVLAGQGGRLFIELRDKASLAYTVSPMRMEGIDAGYFGAYIGCTPSKGKKAISMLNIEFQKLVDTKISDVELDRAKRYLIGRHDIDLQRNSAIGSTILFNEIYGIPSAEAFAFAEKLRDISAKDVQNLAQDLFSQKPVLAAVGPEQPW
jgi:zinc protease